MTGRPNRRTLLRGAGVTLGLPWLESLQARGATKSSPRRFAVLFMGNGINPNHWWAKQRGDSLELGKSLQPLAKLQHKLNVIDGLYHQATMNVGIHPPQTGNLLSGAPVAKGAELRAGVSMDQLLARHFADETPQPSLTLACELPTTGYHETNYSLAYSSHLSWDSETSPVPLELYPSLAWDSLVENRGSQRMQSVLDRVGEEATALRPRLGATDRVKLDEYLTSVRELEKRVARAARRGGTAATAAPPGFPRPADGMPTDLREHHRLMCDIIALAFQTDKTRVATLILCRDLSGLTYPFLDVAHAHHGASHSETSDEYERICRYYCGVYAALAAKLDAMPEGDGTVLDHSCLMFLSNMWSGSKHDSKKLPVLLTGGLGGRIRGGRTLDYMSRGNDNRRLCSLYLSVMDAMGLSLPRFGDTDRRLADL